MLNDESFGMKLYGAISLPKVLNDDTDSGQLILSSCSHLLLTLSDLTSAKRPRVYEVELLPGVERKDTVYVLLHVSTLRELGLSNGTTVDVEVQFQLNRSNFVRMHEAVDAIRSSDNLHVLFPITPVSRQPSRRPLR